MNSFLLRAVGNLARNPEMIAENGGVRTRFCLVGTDYAGKDDVGNSKERVTSVWFVAFGALAETLARNARKGDQLILEASVHSNIWTDKEGGSRFDHDFICEGFRFGAPGKLRRDELAQGAAKG
jgi:single-strand DNA-binding protein